MGLLADDPTACPRFASRAVVSSRWLTQGGEPVDLIEQGLVMVEEDTQRDQTHDDRGLSSSLHLGGGRDVAPVSHSSS